MLDATFDILAKIIINYFNIYSSFPNCVNKYQVYIAILQPTPSPGWVVTVCEVNMQIIGCIWLFKLPCPLRTSLVGSEAPPTNACSAFEISRESVVNTWVATWEGFGDRCKSKELEIAMGLGRPLVIKSQKTRLNTTWKRCKSEKKTVMLRSRERQSNASASVVKCCCFLFHLDEHEHSLRTGISLNCHVNFYFEFRSLQWTSGRLEHTHLKRKEIVKGIFSTFNSV